MKGIFVLKTLFLFFLSLSAPPSQPIQASVSEPLLVRCEPEFPVNGSPIVFRVRSAKLLKSLTGVWQRRKVFFSFDAADRTWYGFGGVDIDAVSGQHLLKLEATLASGARIPSSHPVMVGKAPYQTIDLSVSRMFTEPDAETLARIKKERAYKGRAFRRITRRRLWSGRFAAPLDNVITDRFGTVRTFNGAQHSVHHGLDFRADPGTPVEAMNNGSVIIARNMFYEGGFVVIDHGQGLLTLYMHLSNINVNEGDSINKGARIGLSGESGRTTGPHLHVGVRWQGIYLDPETLLALSLD
jgi:hypothetical protein